MSKPCISQGHMRHTSFRNEVLKWTQGIQRIVWALGIVINQIVG